MNNHSKWTKIIVIMLVVLMALSIIGPVIFYLIAG